MKTNSSQGVRHSFWFLGIYKMLFSDLWPCFILCLSRRENCVPSRKRKKALQNSAAAAHTYTHAGTHPRIRVVRATLKVLPLSAQISSILVTFPMRPPRYSYIRKIRSSRTRRLRLYKSPRVLRVRAGLLVKIFRKPVRAFISQQCCRCYFHVRGSSWIFHPLSASSFYRKIIDKH